jgi:hypothetical protein
MATLSAAPIFALALDAGFSREEAVVATAIALAESAGNPRAHNDNPATGDDSYGLWQINMFDRLGPARRRALGLRGNDELFDPATNARAAHHVFAVERQGFGAWSVFRNGRYKDHLPAARAAAARARALGPARPDLTVEELLQALESPRGQRVLQTATTDVFRAAFAGHAPGLDEDAGKLVRPSQTWLFGTVERIRRALGA